ncbi:MAG: glycine zipper 2TM domain-containing protein [Betaproteobacteria bacterium]|nr:MAG: glycine zipper 2TM domain-containing protein [Betaproteobacteria bacterium]
MEQVNRSPLHPLVVVAAVAVIVFCAVGVAAITGLIPTSGGTSRPDTEPASTPVEQVTPVPPKEAPRPRMAAPQAPSKPQAARPTEPAPPPQPASSPQWREPPRVASSEPQPSRTAPVCMDCGVIESVREVQQPGQGTGVGAVAGGVAGAVLGNQVGGGRGRDLATVVGAVGGAVAGHQIEKRVRTNSSYQVTVRMDDGSVRTFTEHALPAWRTGDRVRVQGERVTSEG